MWTELPGIIWRVPGAKFFIVGTAFCAIMALLSACGGTVLEFSGPLCGGGTPATIHLADKKDRAGFAASCKTTTYRPDGTVAGVSEVSIGSSESNTSQVIQAQADAIAALAARGEP